MAEQKTQTQPPHPPRESTCVECGDKIVFSRANGGMTWLSWGPLRRGALCADGWGHIPNSSL